VTLFKFSGNLVSSIKTYLALVTNGLSYSAKTGHSIGFSYAGYVGHVRLGLNLTIAIVVDWKNRHLGAISPTFYKQFLHSKIPKAQK